jgi:hypothetical protein
MTATTTCSSGVAVETAGFAYEQAAPAEVVGGRNETPDESEHGVRFGVGRLVGATQRPIGDEEKQGTE